jgi:DNA-binding beta-propeller fold protein YncE
LYFSSAHFNNTNDLGDYMKKHLLLSIASILALTATVQAQNLFVSAALGGTTITEITPGGAQTTFASGLVNPHGLAFSSAGNVFEADQVSSNIYEFTPGGTRSTFASGLNGPWALAFNSAGDLFESDILSGNIYEFTPGGTRSTFASGLYYPTGLAFDSAGNLFEADNINGIINKFTPGGVESAFATSVTGAAGLAFNNAGDLFVAGTTSGNIYEITPGGSQSIIASGLYYPWGLALQPVPEPSARAMIGMSVVALFSFAARSKSSGQRWDPVNHGFCTHRSLDWCRGALNRDSD